LHCGTMFTPKRSTGRYCPKRACLNDRRRLSREKRLGK
jgi:hypothetical protein